MGSGRWSDKAVDRFRPRVDLVHKASEVLFQGFDHKTGHRHATELRRAAQVTVQWDRKLGADMNSGCCVYFEVTEFV